MNSCMLIILFPNYYRYEQIVGVLLRCGANVNLVDKLGCTPLFLAVQHNSLPVVEAMINKDADISFVNIERDTILHYAAMADSELSVLQFLLSK